MIEAHTATSLGSLGHEDRFRTIPSKRQPVSYLRENSAPKQAKLMLARSYQYNVARFAHIDPEEPAPGQPASWNKYTYAMNNPMIRTDPTGRFSLFGIRIGGTIGRWGDSLSQQSDGELRFSVFSRESGAIGCSFPSHPYQGPIVATTWTRDPVGRATPTGQPVPGHGLRIHAFGMGIIATRLLNAYDAYIEAQSQRFRGDPLSNIRHCTVSCEMARKIGVTPTAIAGIGVEIGGLLRRDLPNIGSRMDGTSSWAFSFEDLGADAWGTELATRDGVNCEQACRGDYCED